MLFASIKTLIDFRKIARDIVYNIMYNIRYEIKKKKKSTYIKIKRILTMSPGARVLILKGVIALPPHTFPEYSLVVGRVTEGRV